MSPLINQWWIYRHDGQPVGEWLIMSGGWGDRPDWGPITEMYDGWDLDEPISFFAERFVEALSFDGTVFHSKKYKYWLERAEYVVLPRMVDE